MSAVRRRLLAALQAAPSGPIAAGLDFTTTTGNVGVGFRIFLAGTTGTAKATGSGVLTNVKTALSGTGTFAVFTYDPATMLVRDITANISGTAAVTSYAIAGLTVATNDAVGFWSSDGTIRPKYVSDVAYSYDDNSDTTYNTKPVAGTSLTVGTTNNRIQRRLALYLTG